MANSNDFTPFATGVGANVLAPATWAADPAKTAGFSSGIAPSVKLNTAWRQSTFVSAMIAQFTADFGPGNVVDNGNLPAFEAQFEAALTSFLASFFQKIILTNTTYFVNNSIGSDTLYDGTSATISGSSGPWATIAHAIKILATYNLNGNTVTVQLANTGVAYTAPSAFNAPSNGTLLILGDPASQASYIIQGSPSAGNGVLGINGGSARISGLSIRNTAGTGVGLFVGNAGVSLANVTFLTSVSTSAGLLVSTSGGSASIGAGCIFAGNAVSALIAQAGGSITQSANSATGSASAYSGAFLAVSGNGSFVVSTSGLSWSGSATGTRVSASTCGTANTAGVGATFFPGNATVAPTSGGQVV